MFGVFLIPVPDTSMSSVRPPKIPRAPAYHPCIYISLETHSCFATLFIVYNAQHVFSSYTVRTPGNLSTARKSGGWAKVRALAVVTRGRTWYDKRHESYSSIVYRSSFFLSLPPHSEVSCPTHQTAAKLEKKNQDEHSTFPREVFVLILSLVGCRGGIRDLLRVRGEPQKSEER